MQLFHKTVNRRGTHSIKWDTYKNEELIHAWIADMDFEVPQPIQAALKKRIEHTGLHKGKRIRSRTTTYLSPIFRNGHNKQQTIMRKSITETK